MNFLLLFLSLSLETGKNIFSNNFGKNYLKNNTDVYKFNMLLYIGSFITLLVMGNLRCSLFTLITAFIFAAVTAASQMFFLKALRYGHMSFTTFVQCSSMIIPTLYGIIMLGEKMTVLQMIAIPLLIFAMALVLGIRRERANSKWVIFSLLAMLFTGLIGIMQTVHQTSSHSDELFGFLTLAFLFASAFNAVLWVHEGRKRRASFSVKSRVPIHAGLSGIFMGIVNVINLYLAGVMPKVLFFPISNGGLIFMTSLCGVVIFKEKLNVKQWIGMAVGIAALCCLGI